MNIVWILLSPPSPTPAHDGIVIKIEVQTNDEGSESLETPEPLMGQVEEHGFQDSELGDPCGEQPDLDMQERDTALEESTEGSNAFSELKQMLVQQRNCAGELGEPVPLGPKGTVPVGQLRSPSERWFDVNGSTGVTQPQTWP